MFTFIWWNPRNIDIFMVCSCFIPLHFWDKARFIIFKFIFYRVLRLLFGLVWRGLIRSRRFQKWRAALRRLLLLVLSMVLILTRRRWWHSWSSRVLVFFWCSFTMALLIVWFFATVVSFSSIIAAFTTITAAWAVTALSSARLVFMFVWALMGSWAGWFF